MPRRITPKTTVEHLKTDAKRWLKALRANDGEAHERLHRVFPDASDVPTLRDVQHALALEHGFPGWTALTRRFAPDAPIRRYEQVADALVIAYATRPTPVSIGTRLPPRLRTVIQPVMSIFRPLVRRVDGASYAPAE